MASSLNIKHISPLPILRTLITVKLLLWANIFLGQVHYQLTARQYLIIFISPTLADVPLPTILTAITVKV